MTEHDVFVGFRLRLFTLADELGNVSLACRAIGVDRSTYHRWKHRVGRWGLEALNVRERRRPRMPNQIGPHLEQRIIACALGHPGYGPRRISAELVRAKGAASASPSTASGGSYAASASTRAAKRLALMARHRDPYERRPDPPPAERHIDATTPGEKVQLDAASSADSPAPGPTATVASNASNSPSSLNAGDPRSRAHSYPRARH